MSKVTKDTVLIFIVEGDPYVGSLADWAKAQEHAHYSGFDAPSKVWVVEMEFGPKFTEHTPEFVDQRTGDDDYSYTDYVLGDQHATVTIDLRA